MLVHKYDNHRYSFEDFDESDLLSINQDQIAWLRILRTGYEDFPKLSYAPDSHVYLQDAKRLRNISSIKSASLELECCNEVETETLDLGLLRRLELRSMSRLRDLSFLAHSPKLQVLFIQAKATALKDFEVLTTCKALQFAWISPLKASMLRELSEMNSQVVFCNGSIATANGDQLESTDEFYRRIEESGLTSLSAWPPQSASA